MTAIDRALIDEQIRATQQHVVDDLINGTIATWFLLDTTSAAVVAGDVIVNASSPLSTVTKATTGALALAGGGIGVVLAGATPGSPIRVAVFGQVAPSVTSLAAATGMVRINTSTGRLQKVTSLTAGDYPAGFVDNQGNLTLGFAPQFTAGGPTGGFTNVYTPTGAGTTTITDIVGRILVCISGITGPIMIAFPSAPGVGMEIRTKVKDTSLTDANTLTVNGGAKHVEFEGSSTTTSLVFNPENFGAPGGGSIDWAYDGTLWVSG